MSETRTSQEPPVNPPLDTSPQGKTADPLQDSLEEMARMADSLVDDLALEEPEESSQEAQPRPQPTDGSPLEPLEQALQAETAELTAEPQPATDSIQLDEPTEQPDEMSQSSRRAAMKETLDALSNLIDDPSPPPTSAEVEFEGDRGEDIAACLDMVMAPSDETLEAEPVAGEIGEDDTTETEVSEKTRSNDPPVAPPDPSEETEVETAVAIGTESAEETATITSTETSRRSTGIWWLLAVVVVIAALAASYWVLNSGSTTTPTTTNVEVPLPDPPVVYTKRPQNTVPTDRTAPAEPSPVKEVASITAPVIATAATEPVEPPTDPAPSIELATQPAAAVAPTVTQAHDTAPQIEETAPETGVPARTEGGALGLTPAVIASRGKTTETGGPQPQAAGVVGISLAEITRPPEPKAPEPVAVIQPKERRRSVTVEPVVDDPPEVVGAPASVPPVLVDRIEPIFDQRKLRRGEEESVLLRVLVNERGRVVRVVVDESVSGSDAESAAINAVLRWTYEPALETGQPVRSWTTERFEFSRPD